MFNFSAFEKQRCRNCGHLRIEHLQHREFSNCVSEAGDCDCLRFVVLKVKIGAKSPKTKRSKGLRIDD